MRFLVVILLLVIPALANAQNIPSAVKDAIDVAYATGNDYVLDSVLQVSKGQNPAKVADIDNYVKSLKIKTAKQEQVKKFEMAKADKKKQRPWKASVDAGLSVIKGNTDNKDANIAADINYKRGQWTNILKLAAQGSEENAVQTNEKYQANNQLRYALSERDYAFFELEYVNDRFSGFDYRISELLGYGHSFYKNDEFLLDGQISAGGRQSALTDGSKEETILGKVALKGEWKITDGITLSEDLSSSFGSDAVITISDTAIKTQMAENLYLKFNYNIQHIDNVPAGKKHMDTKFIVGVGYEF